MQNSSNGSKDSDNDGFAEKGFFQRCKVEHFDAGNADANRHHVMEDPVVNEEGCYDHRYAYEYAESLAYPEFLVEACSEGFVQVEYFIEADEDEESSEGDPEVM